jgi:outer membrane biosynthesis protein TonB
MASFKPSTFSRSDPLKVGVPLSLLIHAALLAVILSSNAPHPPLPTVIDITLEPPSLLRSPKKEIVSPSVQKSEKPPEDTNRLSDLDSVAIREQVQRGNDGGAPGPRSSSQPQRQQEQSKPSQQSPTQPKTPPAPKTPKEAPPQRQQPSPQKGEHLLKSLKLDDAELAMKFGAPAARNAPSSPASSRSNLSEYQAFSRPPGSGAAFLGTAGISDHLPNLPDGDITMLNAKANIYASFVRRVAIQVFTQIRSQGWERLSRQQLQQLDDFATIEAVLSKKGDLMDIRLISGSGSSAFDSVLKLSVNAGAKDPNPPPGAEASDGLIHFIFKARSWSQMAANSRTGFPAEHRWLLLATGLE